MLPDALDSDGAFWAVQKPPTLDVTLDALVLQPIAAGVRDHHRSSSPQTRTGGCVAGRAAHQRQAGGRLIAVVLESAPDPSCTRLDMATHCRGVLRLRCPPAACRLGYGQVCPLLQVCRPC